VQVAIIRPGPIVGKMLNPYLKRRQGLEPVEWLHPSLEPVLKRTLGVPLFQEQLLRIAMIAAGFSGGQAEELRRAFGFKRSEARMADIEVKLRKGMTEKGINGNIQDAIIQSITSFALYGFPESHAASFALIAYASAYLKCHYLGAFTAALLNNQPMGFYHPATLVKDAQRHGLRVLPVDVTHSEWPCIVTPALELRLGLNYVRGLRKAPGDAIVSARADRPFANMADLVRRVPELSKDELRSLAEIGALNFVEPERNSHRRDALWHAESAMRPTGALLESANETQAELAPLEPMNLEERVNADYRGTGLTVGSHPMALRRAELNTMKVVSAEGLKRMHDGQWVRIAGSVICRQRPGTAKGFVFLSLEDETGISNAIVTPDVFDQNKLTIVGSPYLLIDGVLQNQQNVISVRAQVVEPLRFGAPEIRSKDFS
jgi:error-prone DNA polymerase